MLIKHQNEPFMDAHMLSRIRMIEVNRLLGVIPALSL